MPKSQEVSPEELREFESMTTWIQLPDDTTQEGDPFFWQRFDD